MRNKPYLQKECRHMLTGRVLFQLCSHNYECKDCGYDQLLYEYDQLPFEEDLSIHAAPTSTRLPALWLPMTITITKGTVGRG
jgi:hypothetical protein